MTIVAMGGGRSGRGKSGGSWRGCVAGEEDDRWEEELEKKMEVEGMVARRSGGGGGGGSGLRTAASQ